MFNQAHIIFMIVSLVLIVGFLILSKCFIKSQNKKDLILKLSAIATLILHYSPLYVNFFTEGKAEIFATMILPLYPCNVAMWLLVIVAFIRNKNSKIFTVLATILFYLGIIGGVFGIVLNEIYSNNPTLADWHVLHGLLSHDTLLFGSIWVAVGGYMKIRVRNLSSIIIGLLSLVVLGWSMIGLYRAFNLDPVNCMFLLEPPIASLPFLNTYLIGLGALLILFLLTALYEQLALKKEDRWYSKIKNKRS